MKKHILLIEDDRIVRENTAEILRFSDYKVSMASNGKEGVEKAKTIYPDLILCDILMPKLNGFAVFQIISKDKKLANTPFIFLTAKSSNADRRKGMELGADDYITKPFDESSLLNAIHIRLKKAGLHHTNITPDGINETTISKLKINSLKELIKVLCEKPHHIYNKGDSLFCEGNRSNHVFLIKKGSVKTYKNTEEGKELITGLFKENHFIGYTSSLGDFSHAENAETLEYSKLIKIDNQEINSILNENPHIAVELIGMLANNIRTIKEGMLQMAYGSVRNRTARSLLILNKKSKDKNILISRYDLASFTGIAKETLIRTLSDFKSEGLIESHRNFIKIIDKVRLCHVR